MWNPPESLRQQKHKKIESLGIEIKIARVSNHVEQCIGDIGGDAYLGDTKRRRIALFLKKTEDPSVKKE